MNKICVFLLTTTLFAAPTKESEKPNYHQIDFGVENASFKLKTKIQDISVKGTRPFIGVHLGYEYLKPNALYAKYELSAMNSRKNFAYTQGGASYSSTHSAEFGGMQLSMGYTFQHHQQRFSPFGGIGLYSLRHRKDSEFEMDLPYLSLGLRAETPLHRVVSLAVRGEVFRHLSLKEQVKIGDTTFKRHIHSWGGKVELPVSFHCSSCCDLVLRPYFTRLIASDMSNLYGGSATLSFQF